MAGLVPAIHAFLLSVGQDVDARDIGERSDAVLRTAMPGHDGRIPRPRMIPRYTRPEMAAIWDPQTRFRIWFEIEAHATDALAELGVVPKDAARAIWAKGKNASFDVARIDE